MPLSPVEGEETFPYLEVYDDHVKLPLLDQLGHAVLGTVDRGKAMTKGLPVNHIVRCDGILGESN